MLGAPYKAVPALRSPPVSFYCQSRQIEAPPRRHGLLKQTVKRFKKEHLCFILCVNQPEEAER